MTLRKQTSAVCLGALLSVIIAACTGKNQKDVVVEENRMELSSADTTEVTTLMNQYFDLLLKKDFDGALSMVSQLNDDSLSAMTPELKAHYLMGMKIIQPLRYEIELMQFETEKDCLVKYSAILFDKESFDDNRPNKMFYVIKPVRIDGKWHLTVADDDDMNTRDSKIAK